MRLFITIAINFALFIVSAIGLWSGFSQQNVAQEIFAGIWLIVAVIDIHQLDQSK